MKTRILKLEEIQEEFGVPTEIGLEGIARGGSILPEIVCNDNDENIITSVTLCDSISGGQDVEGNMPNKLSLIRYIQRDGHVEEIRARYRLIKE